MVFTKEDWTQALKEVYRVLKPGGWIQLLEPEVMVLYLSTCAVMNLTPFFQTSGNEIIQKFSNDRTCLFFGSAKKVESNIHNHPQ